MILWKSGAKSSQYYLLIQAGTEEEEEDFYQRTRNDCLCVCGMDILQYGMVFIHTSSTIYGAIKYYALAFISTSEEEEGGEEVKAEGVNCSANHPFQSIKLSIWLEKEGDLCLVKEQ